MSFSWTENLVKLKEGSVCELCTLPAESRECEHPKNGYCSRFREQAKKDAVEFGMKESQHKVEV